MLQEVGLGHRSLSDYTHIVGRELVEEIGQLAEKMEGKRVLHVSATAFGGGVSEILYTMVPLMRDVGLDAHWQVILGKEEFFNVTKLMHNSLQGDPATLSAAEWDLFERYNWMNAQGLKDEWDVIIIHDPQPVGLKQNAPEASKHWIWRCHIDLSTPNADTIAGILPQIKEYDLSVWHMQQYVPESLNGDGVRIVPPAIDPLSPKNMALSPDDAAFVCDQFGIDVERPLMTQVSRFDPWKDPMGVIDAYRIVHEQVPEVQLALVGSMATDDPEGWEFFHQTFQHADGDPDIKILNNLNNVGAIEVNAFQSQSDVGHPEVPARRLRPDRDRGALEGPPDDRRQRRRDRPADRRRRLGFSGRLAGADGSAHARAAGGSRAWPSPRQGGQGACPPRVPDAAAAARLAEDVPRARQSLAGTLRLTIS